MTSMGPVIVGPDAQYVLTRFAAPDTNPATARTTT